MHFFYLGVGVYKKKATLTKIPIIDFFLLITMRIFSYIFSELIIVCINIIKTLKLKKRLIKE